MAGRERTDHDDNALTWPFDRLAALEKRLLFFVIAASLTAMYVMYEYFVPSVPAWVQFKILRMQHRDYGAGGSAAGEAQSGEQDSHAQGFHDAAGGHETVGERSSLLVTPDAIRKWRLFRPHKFRLERDCLVKQKKAEAPRRRRRVGGRRSVSAGDPR